MRMRRRCASPNTTREWRGKFRSFQLQPISESAAHRYAGPGLRGIHHSPEIGNFRSGCSSTFFRSLRYGERKDCSASGSPECACCCQRDVPAASGRDGLVSCGHFMFADREGCVPIKLLNNSRQLNSITLQKVNLSIVKADPNVLSIVKTVPERIDDKPTEDRHRCDRTDCL